MTVQVDTLTLPRSGRLEMNVHLSADIHITAAMAQRRVSRLAISEIGNLLYGAEPSLIVGKRICWRVPVMLAYPDTGPVGPVGALDVDIETGEILVSSEKLTEMTDYAHYLAQRTPAAAA